MGGASAGGEFDDRARAERHAADGAQALMNGQWEKGRIDESMRDIQPGLAINPESQELQKTLAIARARERLQQEQLDNLLES